MILPRMTSFHAKKLASASELVTLSRLLVRMITIGGRVNWKTPKMELPVSFLLLNFRNGMIWFLLLCFVRFGGFALGITPIGVKGLFPI